MAKYDPDRIADLAAGCLDPAEAAALEAEIASDPRAAAELAAQRLTIDALRHAPAPMLAAAERAELHRAVAAALHLEEAPQPAAAAARRRLPWRPLAVAGAALVALIAAVPLFGLLSTGGDKAVTTVALEATTDAPEGAVTTSGPRDQGNLGLTGAQTDSTTAATTTTAAVTTLAGTLSPEERAMADADQAVAGLMQDPAALFTPAPSEVVPCREEALILLGADDPTGVVWPLAKGSLAVWFLSDDGTHVRQLVALAPDTCQLLAVYP